MDFESLPGSQIYLTRQLELRWFHHWEVSVDEVAKSAASNDDHDNAMMTRDHDNDVNHPTNNGNGQFKGRLVRKQRHTMPFLQRNIATNTNYSASRSLHIIKRHRANVRGRPNRELMIAIQNGKYNPSSSFAASLGKNKNKVIGVGGKKRTAATGEGSAKMNKSAHSDGTTKNKKLAAAKKGAQQSAPRQQKPRAQKQHTSSSSSTDSFPSFAIYSQTSSSIRTKLLDALPKEFHGDETFILDKLREQWLLASRESKRLNSTAGEGNDDVAADDRTSGNEEDESTSLPPVNESTTATKRTNTQLNDEEQQEEFVDLSLPLTVSSNTNNRSVIPPLDMAMSSLQKYDGTKQRYEQNQSLPPAYFHYVFMQPNNVLGTHVEEVDGRVCPLCNNLFDGETNEGLLRHLGNCHGTLIESPASKSNATDTDVDGIKPREDGAYFEAALGEEGQLHIVVRGVPFSPNTNHDKDFVFVQPRLLCKKSSNKVNNQQQQQTSNNIPYLQRQHHKTATLDPITRNKKLLTLQSNDAPASAISAYLPTDTIPLRRYFHADTNLPMSNDSWDKDDSCNNVDETWRSNMSSELLDDIEDVTPKEKMFMKLWNGYIKCNHVLADRDMSFKCCDFVQVHCEELVRGELRLNLLLHFFNLWDNGVISEDRILVCMEVFDEYGR